MNQVTTAQTQKSRVSLWKPKSQNTKVVLTGKLQLTPALLAELSAQTPDNYGRIEADIVIFKNDSDNQKAPKYTGYVDVAEQESDDF
jgi:hypothetical protein